MHDFLAADFARLDVSLLQRCHAIDGKRVYFSGATGFFGKNLLALFAELHRRGASFSVTALSRDPERFLATQPWCRTLPWLRWCRGNALDPWPGEAHYELLLHAATDTIASAHRDKLQVFEDIMNGSRQALAFAGSRGVKRLLLCGSGAEYGAMSDSADGVSEADPRACNPSDPDSAYGEAKRASEMLAALQAPQLGFAAVNVRGFAFVGPGLPLDGHFAIGNFLRAALEGRRIELNSAGLAVRSYMYSADLAIWLLLLLLEAQHGTTVNVGSDAGIRIIDLAHKVRALVNPELDVQAGVQRHAEERQFYVPAVVRARKLGLDVWTGLDQAITRTAEWHRLQRAEAAA